MFRGQTARIVASLSLAAIVALGVTSCTVTQKSGTGTGSSDTSSAQSSNQQNSTVSPLVDSNGTSDSNVITAKLASGISYGNGTVRWNGTIDGIQDSSDGSANGHWVVVNAYAPSYATADNLLTSNVQSAAALAHELSQYQSIQKVVWNGYADTNSGKKAIAMQVTYTTADVPAELNSDTSVMIQRAESYNIKDVLYKSLKDYSSVPQKK